MSQFCNWLDIVIIFVEQLQNKLRDHVKLCSFRNLIANFEICKKKKQFACIAHKINCNNLFLI